MMLLPRRRQGYIIDVRFTFVQRIEGPHSSGDTIPSTPARLIIRYDSEYFCMSKAWLELE
jgi:hypothetical protein